MTIFQVEYDVVVTHECPPGRGGFCVPTHRTVTNTEHYTKETAARIRMDFLKKGHRTDGGTVTGVRMERIHIGGMDVFRQRIRNLFRRDDDDRDHDADGGQTA